MGQTRAEKILERKSSDDDVSPGDHIFCDVDVAATNDLTSGIVLDLMEEYEIDTLADPSSIVMVMDHISPSHTVDDANEKKEIRDFVEEHGIEHFHDVGRGILHEVLAENGHFRPGDLVVGGDSHTISGGVFGAGATGVGMHDITYIYATGGSWFQVPESIKFEVTGEFAPRVSSKDLVLHIAGEHGTDVGRYKAIEYCGNAIESLSIDDRFTLSNMGIELGAKFTFTPVDEKVIEYVDERTDEPFDPVRADADAEYERKYTIDADELRPQVSVPHSIENVVDVTEVAGTDLDQVFIGSCTNGKYDDLEIAAEILEGETRDPTTRVIVTPASREIYARAERNGLLEVFNDFGATVTNSTCGACLGMSTGLLGKDEVCLAAQNRNYKGRMGDDESEVYLSSPETAAASAITGEITDPRGF